MKIYKIENGFFSLDGGCLFGAVPKSVWNEAIKADENNCCKLVMRSLLVEDDDKLILFDTGVGIKHLELMENNGFHGIQPFDNLLSKLGYTCADITDVVLSHLHFEHCGGCTYIDYNFSLQLTFPNAKHWCSEAQWKNLITPDATEEFSYISPDMMEVSNRNKLCLIKENTQLTKNITLKLYNGHSLGQIVSFINGENKNYIFTGDVIPTSAHLPLLWNSALDINLVESYASKKNILEEALNNNSILIYPHDIDIPASNVVKTNDFTYENILATL